MAKCLIGSNLERGTLLAVCLGVALMLGCQPSESSKTDKIGAPEAASTSSKAAAPVTEGSGKKPEAGQPAKVEKGQAGASKSEADKQLSANDILQRMVDVYRKASSYADTAKIRLEVESRGEKFIDQTIPLSVAVERPNKLRLHAYQAMLVCDGREIHAALESIPRQVLVKPAPAQLGMKMFRIDPSLWRAIGDFAGPPPQLVLLFSDDPLRDILRGVEGTKLVEPSQLDGRECYRVQLARPEGNSVFWIDQQTFLLRRIVMAADPLRADLPKDRPIDRLSLMMEISDARIDQPVGGEAYQFEMPKDAAAVDLLVPPHMAHLLTKPVPEFKFYDLKGQPVTRESFAGKIVVFDFWATWCAPCKESLPQMQKVYEKYKDNPKVVIVAVSVDQPEVKNEELTKAFQNLNVQIPILRDREQTSSLFQFPGIPSRFIVDAKGNVQDCEGGFNPKLAEALPAKIEKLLAGESIFQEPLKRYEEELEQLKQYAKEFEAAGDKPVEPEGPTVISEERLPEAKVNPRSEPTNLKLTPLWKCNDVKHPGNIVVVGGKAGQRIMVVDRMKTIAEVGLDGKLVANHDLGLATEEVIGNLRAAKDGDGRWYTVAFLPSNQRCHVMDEEGKLVVHYPDDALKNRHSGIADVQLGDLDGSGKLKLYVSYWESVGVQCASFDGKRIWSNRAITNVGSMATGAAQAGGQRELFYTGMTGSIGVLDARGERHGDFRVGDRVLYRIAAADLLGNGELSWCGTANIKLGENIAIGFSLKGAELWNYEMPRGVHRQPIELMIPGNVLGSTSGQWMLPGPDGSIHIVSAEGKLIDKFAYGTSLHGLATVSIDGQPVLVVASANGLEAWKVEPRGK